MKIIESAQLAKLLKFVLIGYTVVVDVEFGGEIHGIELSKKSLTNFLKNTAAVKYHQNDETKTVTVSAAPGRPTA
jgi:hypothetical protein